MAEATAPSTASEYIVEHLTHFSNKKQVDIIDFSVFNYDTIFWSIVTGVAAVLFMYVVARKATAGVPGRTQALIELVVEMVEDQSKAIVKGDRRYVAPLALTLFMWVLFMNCLDFLPVDWVAGANLLISSLGFHGHIPHHRVVPSADLNGTLGMSFGVLSLMVIYGIKEHKFSGFFGGLFTAPFHAHGVMAIFLAPVNLLENLLGFAAKSISLGMRLFGNMYAGELVFMLIALLGSTYTWWGIAMHGVLGAVWAVFHILIVLLQAFIFMMLTLVYLGQARDGH